VFGPDFANLVELLEPLPLNWMDHLIKLVVDRL